MDYFEENSQRSFKQRIFFTWVVGLTCDKILTHPRFIYAGFYFIARSTSNDPVDEIQIGARRRYIPDRHSQFDL